MTRHIQDVTTGGDYYASYDDWWYCDECPRGGRWWVDDDPDTTFDWIEVDDKPTRAMCPVHGCGMCSYEEMERRSQPEEDF